MVLFKHFRFFPTVRFLAALRSCNCLAAVFAAASVLTAACCEVSCTQRFTRRCGKLLRSPLARAALERCLLTFFSFRPCATAKFYIGLSCVSHSCSVCLLYGHQFGCSTSVSEVAPSNECIHSKKLSPLRSTVFISRRDCCDLWSFESLF